MTGPRVCTCGSVVIPAGAFAVERPGAVHRPDPEDCEPIPAPAAALEHALVTAARMVLVAFAAMAACCFAAMFLADLVR